MDAARTPDPTARRRLRRRLLGALAASGLGLLSAPIASQADLQGNRASRSAAAGQLRSAIAAETRLIQSGASGLARAEARLVSAQAKAGARQAELAGVQRDLVAARNHLTRLENKLHRASTALSANLRATYEGNTPDVITVVLEAHGFADLLDRVDFLQRAAHHDAAVLQNTKAARTQVVGQAVALAGLQARDRALTAEVIRSRDAAAAIQSALLGRQEALLTGRAGKRAQLARVRGQIASLDTRIARAQTQVVAAPTTGSLPIDAGGTAQAPDNAPAAVKQVIAAGNAIAGLPYLYGGGHASFRANAYDCSGSISYALAAAGLVSSPLDSTAFESWGQPGPGQWITVYANAGHAFMVVAGWRFDTVALSQDGTRFTRTMTDTSAFVARHPPGL